MTICHELMHAVEYLRFWSFESEVLDRPWRSDKGTSQAVAFNQGLCEQSAWDEWGFALEQHLLGFVIEGFVGSLATPCWGALAKEMDIRSYYKLQGSTARRTLIPLSMNWLSWWFKATNLLRLGTRAGQFPQIEKNAEGLYI